MGGREKIYDLNEFHSHLFTVPPNILDMESTASSVAVRENQNINMTCRADGFPAPKIIWRRYAYIYCYFKAFHSIHFNFYFYYYCFVRFRLDLRIKCSFLVCLVSLNKEKRDSKKMIF